MLPNKRKLSEIGRNPIETNSRKPTAINTTTMRTFRKPVVSPFGANKCFTNPIGAIRLESPNRPQHEENHRHGQGHVQVRITAAQKGSG